MSANENRIRGMIYGQFAGDAATLGLHWIYDTEELVRRAGGEPAGFEAPEEGHYHEKKQPGDQTHYGDAALLLLESIADCGRFDHRDFGRRFVRRFGDPEYPGYIDKATKGTLDRFREAGAPEAYAFQAGADDDQPATVTRLAPLAALTREKEELASDIRTLVRVTQANAVAEAYALAHAFLLEELLAGSPPLAAVEQTCLRLDLADEEEQHAADRIREVIPRLDERVTAATKHFGQQCPLAASFPAALHAFLKHETDFKRMVLEIIRAGGDSAARAAMAGAWIGATNGLQAIPQDWFTRLNACTVIMDCTEKILRLQKTLVLEA